MRGLQHYRDVTLARDASARARPCPAEVHPSRWGCAVIGRRRRSLKPTPPPRNSLRRGYHTSLTYRMARLGRRPLPGGGQAAPARPAPPGLPLPRTPARPEAGAPGRWPEAPPAPVQAPLLPQPAQGRRAPSAAHRVGTPPPSRDLHSGDPTRPSGLTFRAPQPTQGSREPSVSPVSPPPGGDA